MATTTYKNIRAKTFHRDYKPITITEGQYEILILNEKQAQEQLKRFNNSSAHLWTVIAEGDKWYALNGQHYWNRLGYIVTENPWNGTAQICADFYA